MRGRAHLERRDIKKAEAAYNKADALRPDYAPILLGRVKIHLRRGEFDSAETLADRALVLAPEDAEVWYYKGEVDRLKGNVKPALQYYNKSIEYEAGHLQSRLARAAMYIEMGRPEDARQDLKLVRTIVPGDQRAAFLFALILANDEDVEGAQSILEKSSTAIETADPNFMNDPSSLLLSGFISYARKDYSKAYTYLHRYITLIPHHPGARKLLGAILLRWNDALGAIEYLTPALRLSSEDPQLLVLLGTAYMRAKNFNDATKWFAKAASIAPDKASIRMQLAIGRLATGKIKKGLEDLESALTLDAGKSSVSVTLGMIHLRARNYDKALLIARSLFKQDDQNALAYNLAGTAMAGKRDYAAARANLERAMVIDPTFTQAQSNLAELNRAEGKREAEKQIYQQIAKREPGNTIAMIRLSRIAQIEERNSVAIKWLAKARAVNPNLLKPQLRLIGLYLRERQIPKAFEVALDLTSRNPDNVTVLEALGRVEVAAGQITRAILTFNKIAKLVENSSRGLFLASKLLLFV
jgi:putative PEP-CTERM system TPR-repeat lipoprotein